MEHGSNTDNTIQFSNPCLIRVPSVAKLSSGFVCDLCDSVVKFCLASRQDLIDRSRGFVGDADRAADVGVILLGWIDSERFADRRHQVAGVDLAIGHGGAVLAGLARGLAALDSTAAQNDAPGIGEMVAAAPRVLIDLWRAPELSHPDDQ